MFQLSFLDAHFQDRLPRYPAVGGIVPASAGHHMRNPLPEDMAVRGQPIFTGRQPCRVQDPLCAHGHTRAHGPHRGEVAFARKARGIAGGEALVTAATVIAAAVTAAEAPTETGAGIEFRRFDEIRRMVSAPLCSGSTLSRLIRHSRRAKRPRDSNYDIEKLGRYRGT